MSIYVPDYWKVIEISDGDNEPIKKVFASWSGGYCGSDHWKLSSGTVSIVDMGDYYSLPQYSGSIYNLYKNSEGIQGCFYGLLSTLLKRMGELGATAKVLDNVK